MSEEMNRSSSIPVLYTRGTHYEVGYDIGHTFRSLIESSLSKNAHFNNVLVQKYESEKVRTAYQKLLFYMEKDYPHFVDELRGMSVGSKVPFFKLFLLHIDDVISAMCGKEASGGLLGSTSICCDQENKVILGHSQDYYPEALNHTYIVSAHIMEATARGKWGCAEEKFTALCLPGMLPGFSMSYNHHGFVFTVNTITSEDPASMRAFSLRTPRHFLCRALLTCRSMFDATEILQDEGHGISDGLSVNMIFCRQEGSPLFHNAEVAPSSTINGNESSLSVLTLSSGEYLTHCNKFLRLTAPQSDQLPLWSSNHRHEVLKTLPRVESISNVVAILGDQTDVMYSFFRDGGGKDEARTLIVGIMNLQKKTWSIYTKNPKTSIPVLVLPIVTK